MEYSSVGMSERKVRFQPAAECWDLGMTGDDLALAVPCGGFASVVVAVNQKEFARRTVSAVVKVHLRARTLSGPPFDQRTCSFCCARSR